MTINKFRPAFLAFAIFALIPGSAAVAKPIHQDARNHGTHWTPELRAPAPHQQRPAHDPLAALLLG